MQQSSYGYLKRINIFLLYLFSAFSVIIPNDYHNIKKILFVVLLVVNSIAIYYESKHKSVIIIFGIIFPVSTILFSLVVSNASAFEVISRGYVGIYLLLVLVVGRFNIDFYKIALFAVKVVCLIICLSVLLDLFSVLSIYRNPILMFLNDNGSAKIGKGIAYISMGYMVYLQTSALLLLLVYDSYVKRNIMWLALSCISIFFTGSRAMWIGLVLEIVLLFVFDNNQKSKLFKYLLGFLFIVFTLMSLSSIYQLVTSSFELKSSGDVIRSGHLVSVVQEIVKSPFTFLFGSGYANYFFSAGVFREINAVELSYWDLFRQVGLLGFVFFVCFLLYPISRLKSNKGLLITYIVYLVIAYSNPLLYTSTPYVLYIILYQYILYESQSLQKELVESEKDNHRIRFVLGKK